MLRFADSRRRLERAAVAHFEKCGHATQGNGYILKRYVTNRRDRSRGGRR